jgi:hypothetical protein
MAKLGFILAVPSEVWRLPPPDVRDRKCDWDDFCPPLVSSFKKINK